VADRTVSISVTFGDLWPGFKGHDILLCRISEIS